MSISVNIIKDSISTFGNRIVTLHLKYPRLMHADFMTHRVFSRNAASNRAMPTLTIINNIQNDFVYPLVYFKNQSGMFGEEFLSELEIEKCNRNIDLLWSTTKYVVSELDRIGLHKQHKNRYLEPFQYIDVLLTTTEFKNFFDLRINFDSQPEINEVGKQIRQCLEDSTPNVLMDGEWHLPFIKDSDDMDLDLKKKSSVARCARISYLKHDKENPTLDDDLKRFNDLYIKKHASPFEHIVRPVTNDEYELAEHIATLTKGTVLNDPYFIGNHKGWVSYRRELGL